MAKVRRAQVDIDYVQTIGVLSADDSAGFARLAAMCEDVLLSAVYDDLGYESVEDVRPVQWLYCFVMIQEKIFRQNPKMLKVDGCINNAYDMEKIIKVYDIYYKLSVKYGIEITIEKFCNFTGIDYNTINSMSAKPGGFKLRQKILSDSEQMLASQLTDRRINPIGTLAKLNRWHNWKETASGETSVNITLSESPAALADRYRAKIADNKTALLSDSLTDSDAKQGL